MRWSILTDRLPVTVKIGEEEHELDVRTSTALNCLRKLREDIPDGVKSLYVTRRLGLPRRFGQGGLVLRGTEQTDRQGGSELRLLPRRKRDLRGFSASIRVRTRRSDGNALVGVFGAPRSNSEWNPIHGYSGNQNNGDLPRRQRRC